jgi:predicted Ser/Thr protein kinase
MKSLWIGVEPSVDNTNNIPSAGFCNLVRLLSASPVALDSSIPSVLGPHVLNLKQGGVLNRMEGTYKLLGQGGSGCVFQTNIAEDTVAIKIAAPEIVRHEAEVLRRLNYSDLQGNFFIRLHKQHGADPIALILTPVGTPLQQVLTKDKLADLGLRVEDVKFQVLEAAKALHNLHLVHLDCGRATNFIISNKKVPMIDFGLAAKEGETRCGLVGVLNCAADEICMSESSIVHFEWVVKPDLDNEALKYLFYVLDNQGDVFVINDCPTLAVSYLAFILGFMPWVSLFKEVKNSEEMRNAILARRNYIQLNDISNDADFKEEDNASSAKERV